MNPKPKNAAAEASAAAAAATTSAAAAAAAAATASAAVAAVVQTCSMSVASRMALRESQMHVNHDAEYIACNASHAT